LPLLARRDRVDVLHCPAIRGPFRSAVPLVVTIHDLAPLRHPSSFNTWNRRYTAFALPRVARAADAVIVGSAFARDEVVSVLGVDARSVATIPYGVAPVFQPDGAAATGEYVLAVSTLEPRKNLPRLLEAFGRTSLNGCELRVVGARGWGGVRVGGDRVRWLGEITDEELARQYRGALCVAYVSLYEGFGLPVLEAMACGAAVVAPTGPPYSEFANGVAVQIDPRDSDSIAAGLEDAIGRREALGPLGPQRAAEFDWARAAADTLDVYREVATKRSRFPTTGPLTASEAIEEDRAER
jgi:glycosyltransferase involved in cell wall biosynthesis